jgi:hypothetical protein
MLTALLVLTLLVLAVMGAEFVRAQCRRMLSNPVAPRRARSEAELF